MVSGYMFKDVLSTVVMLSAFFDRCWGDTKLVEDMQ